MSARSNERLLASFIDYLKIEKGLAPLTISAYTTDIGQFAGFLEERNRTLTVARREDVERIRIVYERGDCILEAEPFESGEPSFERSDQTLERINLSSRGCTIEWACIKLELPNLQMR